MTFKLRKEIIEKNNIPEDVELCSDNGGDDRYCSLEGVYYDKGHNMLYLTDGAEDQAYDYSDCLCLYPTRYDDEETKMESIDLIISVPKGSVCSGFEGPFTEEEKDILIKAIGNGIPKVIKTGHWDVCEVTKNGIIENWHKCSVCDWKNALVIPRNYCPKCGAKMDEASESKEHLYL